MGLKYYDSIKDSPLSDLLRKDILNTENTLVAFSDSSGKDCPDTARSTGAYILYIKMGQLKMVNMLQDELLKRVHKVGTIQHALQEFLYHILGC